METAILISAIICLSLAIWEITSLKRKLKIADKSFKKISMLYNKEKEKTSKLLQSYKENNKIIF